MNSQEFNQTRIPSKAEQEWLDSEQGKAAMASMRRVPADFVWPPFVALSVDGEKTDESSAQ